MKSASTTNRAFDVVVIGAGVVGCATALELSRRGVRVALVEAGELGRGTSDNSFAWINATSKTADAHYHRLNAMGASGYRDLAAQWGEDRIGLKPSGMLQWSHPSDPVALNAMRERAKRLQGWGYPVSGVSRSDLIAMEPHVRFDDGVEGLHAFADGWLDVPTFVEFAAQRVRAAGGAVLTRCPARGLVLTDTGTIKGVGTARGTLDAPTVVVTTGPGTPEALSTLTGFAGFATRFPLQLAPGLLVRTPPVEPWRLARHILYTPGAGHFHIRPTPDGGLLLGADDTDGAAASAPEQAPQPALLVDAARTLLERARDIIPRFAGASLVGQCELKVGVRPVPTDGRTIAGPMPGSEGLYLAVTHSGVTLGPALARLLADSIESGETAPALQPFTFDRFQSIG